MSFWEALVFGIVQGLTEFLPISSTAHIVVTQYLLGTNFPGLSLEIFLHFASVLAVIIYFQRDLRAIIIGFLRFSLKRSPEDRPLFFFALYIVVATVITGVLGVLLTKFMGDGLKSPSVVSASLMVTGFFLIFVERIRHYGDRKESAMTFLDSFLVGLGQTVAVLPGISRSGSTLVTSLLVGLNRETAVRYSFLLAIPVILGSTVLAAGDIQGGAFQGIGWPPLAVSFIASFFFSLVGIVWLIEFLKKSRLIYFALYCFIFALFIFFYFDPAVVMDID
ncbi:MAG: undecaprenyl-diphosphate phosphatase [Opitutales bacterium]